MSLLKLLRDAHTAQKNFEDKNFISFEIARKIVTRDRVEEWSGLHPMCQEHGDACSQRSDLIREVTGKNILIYIVLVFAELEFLVKRLVASGSWNLMLFDSASFNQVCEIAKLTADQKHKIVQYRSYVGVIFAHYGSQEVPIQNVPIDAVLPFLERKPLEKFGSYGVLYRVALPGQHLRDYFHAVMSSLNH